MYLNDPVFSKYYEANYMHIYRHRQASLNIKLIRLLPYQNSQRRRVNTKTKKVLRLYISSTSKKDLRALIVGKKYVNEKLIYSLI